MKKYTYKDLVIRPPKEIILRHLPIFDGEIITAETLCLSIKKDAFLLGVESVAYFKKEGWWYIFSDKDWFFLSSHLTQSVESLFKQMHPFPEKGRNACRLECYLWALSKEVYTEKDNQFETIKGRSREVGFFQPKILKNSYERLLIFSDFKVLKTEGGKID